MSRFVFSSDDLPDELGEKERFGLWRDIHNSNIASIDYSVAEDRTFHARIEGAVIGPVIVGDISGSINGAARDLRNIGKDPGSENFNLIINNGVTDMWGIQSGREFLLAPGAGVLIMGFEPTSMRGYSENRWTTIVMPNPLLLGQHADVEDRAARTIHPSSQPLQLLNRYAHMAANQVPPKSPELVAHMSGVILDLAGLSLKAELTAQDRVESRGLREARLAGILQFIQANFRDPGISARQVALRLGLSSRYVHDLLQASGESFGERVLELRLQLSLSILTSPQNQIRSISDIAFNCGFNDISYFNRAFRRRFGCSPKQSR